MWRVVVVGIGVGLLRHDGEVEGAVVKYDAVLELCVRGRAHHIEANAYLTHLIQLKMICTAR